MNQNQTNRKQTPSWIWIAIGFLLVVTMYSSNWLGILLNVALLLVLWRFLIKQQLGAGGGIGRILDFGKSKAKLAVNESPVTFEDVAGVEEAKEELMEIIEFLRDPKKFTTLGGRMPKGCLLIGRPGTGKTLLAKAVAGEAGVPFFSITGSDFVEMFVGVGASRMRDLFSEGKQHAPCIIFIDELDAIGKSRAAALAISHDEREQTLNQLLAEMDGFETDRGIIIFAATNRPEVLDSALIRAGRFDRHIIVPLPDVKGREAILKVHARKIKLAEGVSLEVLARGTPGCSGADLESILNEAALLATRRKKGAVDSEDLDIAKDKVTTGTERKSMALSEETKKTIAYHEAGHAMVAKFTEGADPVHKVSIIPRGMALGITQQLPLDEKYVYTKEYLEGELAILFGGRVAEVAFLNTVSTGAADDLKKATELAGRMVREWGMSDKLGPATWGGEFQHQFLGNQLEQIKNYSEETAREIDEEIKRFIAEAQKKADDIVRAHKKQTLLLAEKLLEKETLDGAELDALIKASSLPL